MSVSLLFTTKSYNSRMLVIFFLAGFLINVKAETKAPTFYLKNPLESKIEVIIKDNENCSIFELEPEKMAILGKAFYIDDIAVYTFSDNKTYIYKRGYQLLPFFHWDYIYDDWKVYLGIANDMYLYLLDDKYNLDKNKQPKGSYNDFPMKYLKIIEGRVDCDYDFKVKPT